MTREEKAIIYFKDMRKRLCEDYLKICPKDSVAYKATLAEKDFYDTAIEALENESCPSVTPVDMKMSERRIKMHDDDASKEIIVIIVSIIIFAFVFFLAYTLSANRNDKLWNGGHCNICGGNLEYEQAVGHRSTTSYIYVCEKCGKRIEISEVR